MRWLQNYLSYKKQSSLFFIEDGQLKEVNLNAAKEKRMNEMTTNRVYPVVRDMEAQIDSAKPLFSADITNYRVQDFDARVQQSIAIKQYEEWEKNGLIDQNRIWFITCGNQVYKMYNNFKGGQYVILSNGDYIKEGKVECDVVPIFDWVADDSYGDSRLQLDI